MASAALQKRGKTTWGFSMPKPLLYLQLDSNWEHALAQARAKYKKAGKDAIRHIRYFAEPTGDLKANNLREWERFCRDFEYGVSNFRSVMVDTASELLDVRKLAEWGRNSQIPKIYYGAFYADFRWFVKRALDSDANVLFIHRLKKEYQGENWNGNFELEGWKGVMFDTQVYVEHERTEEGTFVTTIKDCAQDAMLMGAQLKSEDDENDFAGLATRVFPETAREDWQ